MLRMNFAQELSGNQSFSLDGTPSNPQKSKVWLLVALLVIVGGGAGYYFFGMQEEAPVRAQVVTPAKPNMTAPMPSAQTTGVTGEVASNAQVNSQTLPAKVAPVPKAPVYEVPVHIVSSNESVQRFISGLLKDTPLQVGFNEISILAPNYFYMRGLAGDKVLFKRFESGVKKWVAKVEPPVLKAKGAADIAQDFTLYGQLLQREHQNSNALTAQQKKKAMDDLENYIAKVAGSKAKLLTKGTKTLPKSVKETYVFRSELPFGKLSQLVSNIADKKIPVHLEQLELRVNEQEEMNVELTLALYTKK